MPPTIPAVSTPEKSLLLQAAEMTQGQPWTGPSFRGESAGSQFLAAPLTPRPAAVSHHDGESDAVGGGGGARTSLTCLVRGHLISTRYCLFDVICEVMKWILRRRSPAPESGHSMKIGLIVYYVCTK